MWRVLKEKMLKWPLFKFIFVWIIGNGVKELIKVASVFMGRGSRADPLLCYYCNVPQEILMYTVDRLFYSVIKEEIHK